jgi:hypothetical protein
MPSRPASEFDLESRRSSNLASIERWICVVYVPAMSMGVMVVLSVARLVSSRIPQTVVAR